jgi:hypothetical protein
MTGSSTLSLPFARRLLACSRLYPPMAPFLPGRLLPLLLPLLAPRLLPTLPLQRGTGIDCGVPIFASPDVPSFFSFWVVFYVSLFVILPILSLSPPYLDLIFPVSPPSPFLYEPLPPDSFTLLPVFLHFTRCLSFPSSSLSSAI